MRRSATLVILLAAALSGCGGGGGEDGVLGRPVDVSGLRLTVHRPVVEVHVPGPRLTLEFEGSNPTQNTIALPDWELSCAGESDVIPIDEDVANHPANIEAKGSDHGELAWPVPDCKTAVLTAPGSGGDVIWDLPVPPLTRPG